VQKKIHLARAWAAGYPVWCAWQVNYRCNFRCSFCHYWRDPMGDAPEMTVEQFRRGSQKLSELGALLVSLAGGEPLIRPDIVEIAHAVGEYHFTFLTTNGWFVTRELAEELFAAGLWGVSISIDYADAERHDQRRGMPGAFERALAAIEHFSRARRYKWQRVNWMSVLLDDNIDQIETMLAMAAEHHAYFMVQPYCVRKTGSQRFVYRNQSVSEYLLALRRRHSNFLSNPYFLSRFDEALDGGVPDCKAGRRFFNIDSTGDIAVCVEERARPVANLFDHSAREIVRRLRADDRPSHCRACWYNCRGEIESLYHPWGLIRSLPTYLFDRGRAPLRARQCENAAELASVDRTTDTTAPPHADVGLHDRRSADD
jgi:MoaA/NifB/PqqE/SkfB family radical SAM enzyme